MGCLDKPDSGAVLINGQDVTRFTANQHADLRREEIGFILLHGGGGGQRKENRVGNASRPSALPTGPTIAQIS